MVLGSGGYDNILWPNEQNFASASLKAASVLAKVRLDDLVQRGGYVDA